MLFLGLQELPSVPTLLRVFVAGGSCIRLTIFFFGLLFIRQLIWPRSSSSLDWKLNYVYRFQHIHLVLPSWDKHCWVVIHCYYMLIYCFAYILLTIFVSLFHEGCWYAYFILGTVFVFCFIVTFALQTEMHDVLCFSVFWNRLYRPGVILFLNVG